MGNKQSAIDDVRFGERIGGGSYGEVFKGTWNGRKVALKRLQTFFFEGGLYNQGRVFDNLSREWEILATLSHPNIVEYYTVIVSERAPPIIVTELCQGDLYHFIRFESDRKVPFKDVVNIMSDVAEGLKYLHSRDPPIIHRDLTSKNILLTGNKRAKITDMGLSKAFPLGAMYATAGVGTPVYAAPETYPLRQRPSGRFAKKAYYTEKVDVFSFGAMLLEIIIGRLPQSPLPDPLLENGEVVPEYIRRSEDLCEMGPDHPLHALVSDCLNNLPQDRPSAQDLIDFLASFKGDDDNENDLSWKSKSFSGSKASLQYSESPPVYSSVMKVTKDRYDYNFKIAVVGDSAVGKTSIIQRFLHPERQFLPYGEAKTTIQPADFFHRLQFRGKTIHLHIVDTPGDKRAVFHQASNVVPLIYRGLNGAVIVFDVGDRWSYKNVIDWINAIKERSDEETAMVLVGNKTDLELNSWKISSHDVEAFASERGLFYIETSAVGLINIDEIFCILIERMIHERQRNNETRATSPDWVLYQSPAKRSLLKGDIPPPYQSAITERATARQLSSSNIHLGVSTNLLNDDPNKTRKKKCCR